MAEFCTAFDELQTALGELGAGASVAVVANTVFDIVDEGNSLSLMRQFADLVSHLE
jgi:hypothetical protein